MVAWRVEVPHVVTRRSPSGERQGRRLRARIAVEGLPEAPAGVDWTGTSSTAVELARWEAVRLASRGTSETEIGRLVGRSAQWVQVVVLKYIRGGAAALGDRRRLARRWSREAAAADRGDG